MKQHSRLKNKCIGPEIDLGSSRGLCSGSRGGEGRGILGVAEMPDAMSACSPKEDILGSAVHQNPRNGPRGDGAEIGAHCGVTVPC